MLAAPYRSAMVAIFVGSALALLTPPIVSCNGTALLGAIPAGMNTLT